MKREKAGREAQQNAQPPVFPGAVLNLWMFVHG